MIRRHWQFIIIFVLVVLTRTTILFFAQTHVHSDEAIIGLMGKHILEGHEFPLYFYGQNYNGGAAFEAYLAAFSFLLFGVGVIPLKAVIVLLSLLSLSLFYVIVHQYWGKRAAIFSTLIFALSPTLLKWHFQVRGGYSEYILFILMIGLTPAH